MFHKRIIVHNGDAHVTGFSMWYKAILDENVFIVLPSPSFQCPKPEPHRHQTDVSLYKLHSPVSIVPFTEEGMESVGRHSVSVCVCEGEKWREEDEQTEWFVDKLNLTHVHIL